MTNPALKNISASVREKLRNIARQRNADFGLVLVKYGLERILFRLSRSAYHDVFVLKGALLFELWTRQQYRPTRDADFLARGENSPERFFRIFRELCSVETEPDGLRFDPDTVTAERIAEDADYEGVRVSFTAYLERAKIPIQIDIGFGDAVTPPPVENNYPTLLGSTAPRLLTYPRKTVVAEKLEAMVKLGIANSRMKDFYDMEVLSRTFSFGGKSLREAIHNTFERRGTEYLLAENLERLRSRSESTKRSLALREFALGIEALERFVRQEPLRRVHECVFGVLALESEAVDPRL